MLTAIGRLAARQVLTKSRTSAAKLAAATQLLLRASANQPNALPSGAARSLTLSAWMSSPAKGASTASAKTNKKKKTSSTATAATTKKTKKAATKKKPAAQKKAKKPAAKTKKKAKKPAAKATKKPKKRLTPEQKEKAGLSELKKLALLKRPTLLPETTWLVYFVDNVGNREGNVIDKMKGISEQFARLSLSEKERLQSIAASNHEANLKTRQKWIASYPPEAIYMANIARRRLARKLDKSRLYLIHDDRLPKRALTPYTLFIKSRFTQANEEYANSNAKDTFRALCEEWRSMSESAKQPFREAAEKETEKSRTQLKDLKEKAKVYVKAQKSPPVQVRS